MLDPGVPELVSAVVSFFAAGAAAVTAYFAKRSIQQNSQASQESLELSRQSAEQSRKSSEQSLRFFQDSAKLDRTIQVMVHCNDRYSRLQEEISQADCTDSAKFKSLMVKYWSLKSDQFDYWLAGFVDPDAFVTWFSSTATHFFHDNGLWQGKTYREGWKHGREYHAVINDWFVAFIDRLELAYLKDVTGHAIDREYRELNAIIQEMEGTSEKPGIVRIFREVYSQGMSWEEYKKFKLETKNRNFLAESLAGLKLDYPRPGATP